MWSLTRSTPFPDSLLSLCSPSFLAPAAFLTISVMVLSYSITDGIGAGLVSYTLMSVLAYLAELIKYAFTKKDKPQWNISAVAIIVSLLFCVYFFVPATLF